MKIMSCKFLPFLLFALFLTSFSLGAAEINADCLRPELRGGLDDGEHLPGFLVARRLALHHYQEASDFCSLEARKALKRLSAVSR